MPEHRAQICNCTVALPPKGRPYWAVGAGAPSRRSAVYGYTPAKRETALGCRCRGTERRSALYGCSPAKRETVLGCRCRGTERRSALCGYTPAKRESVLDCKCRGTCWQICNCTVTLPPKGRPYWAVGAGAPSRRSAVYGHTPGGDRAEGAGAPSSRAALYELPSRRRPH